MAQPTNTFDTYDAVGIREDLSDLIFNISPTDLPFFKMAQRGKAASNNLHEWQTDSLAAAAHNAVIQGDDATLDAVTATQRLGNRCQILDKTAVLAGSVEATNRAGRTREMAYQVGKKTMEMMRDFEAGLMGNFLPTNGAITVGSSTIAATFGCVPAWIHTNVSRETTTGAGTNAAFTSGQLDAASTPTDSTVTRALTESLLQTVLQACWTQGGEPDVIMCGPHNKTVISGFTANSNVTRFAMTDDKRLVTALDIYVSDWREHRIVPNRFQRDREVFCLDMNYWGISYLRPPRNWALAKTGDSDKRQILMEGTLEARQEAASGIIADLATS